ncbi:carboxypeptidase-like protein [Gillisia mitskevichiae]|uniref:Carboxypeptidase-like protein n=1 Tax=Gillisia mitskevichiae TaxID=270921 RepID=A0A495PXE5_9FLAO|nr:DUF5686 family protein [Gillisia mitskevichiae]RKS55822.1 carboxypeptidase-like protein [Gillisia mitskevichiae]
MNKFIRTLLFLALFIPFSTCIGQNIINGHVINSENGDPLAYATVKTSDKKQTLTNIDGSFSIKLTAKDSVLTVSYIGFSSKTTPITKFSEYYLIKLEPFTEDLSAVMLYSEESPADKIIAKAIQRKSKNDPEKALKSFQYKSYNKFIIDNEASGISTQSDSSSIEIRTIINQGRAYLSEKTATHLFKKPNKRKELVEGIKTAGFNKPVYDVLSLKAEPLSLYKSNYQLFDTDYAGPLANGAFNNYSYKILDTTSIEGRASYMIYFKPKRQKKVAGLEGVLYLDTTSYAIQKATAQLLGAVKLVVNHNYSYYKEHDLWFPSNQTITLKPGTGGKDISVFGGSISLGTVQRKKSILNTVIGSGEVESGLFLESSTVNYEIKFNEEVAIPKYAATINVLKNANDKSVNYWEANRQIPFTLKDEFTSQKVDSIIRTRNIEKKIRVKKAIANGHLPAGIWDFDLSKFFKFNNYEGIRLGAGGTTNAGFSEKTRLQGYLVYGFKDAQFKYGFGAGTLLRKRTDTWLDLKYSDDIREVGSYKYLKGINDFSILEPRFVNISFYYKYQAIQAGLTHRFTPKLETEWVINRSDITQIGNYAYINDDRSYKDYTIAEATIGFLYRPFSTFLNTPESNQIINKGYPQFTGQISKSVSNILGGDFDFTKVGLKVEYQINRLDLSNTQFTLEGNYAFGDIPLTHAFHSFPNNPNKAEILNRFSIAGKISFETMYFNEFFSDRQAALHIRHQFRPIRITDTYKPELAILNRFVIGDFDDINAHQNIEFNSLKHGFSEAGLEINKLLGGFGLSFAYRYGAYHLPSFKENFSFKFTLRLKI